MNFNFETKDKIELDRPCLLKAPRLIIPEDPQLLQDLKAEYAKVNSETSIFVKAALTLSTSILQSERLYFALSSRSMLKLLQDDENLEYKPKSFSGDTWKQIKYKFYNHFGLISLSQTGKARHASMYRVEHKAIAEYLLKQGVDGALQKEETQDFINVDFTKVSKK